MWIAVRRMPFVALPGILLAGCSDSNHVPGSGNVISQTRQVGAFEAIELKAPVKLRVTCGKEGGSLKIDGDDNILALIQTRVENGRLVVTADRAYRTSNTPSITLDTKNLDALHVSGAAEVDIAGLDQPRFDLSVTGAGEVRLAGKAEALSIEITGAGDVAAEPLQSRTAKVKIKGAGEVAVSTSDTLDVSMTGAGDVTYSGDPKVTKSILGAGTVRRRK